MEMSMLQQVVPRQENYTQSRAVALHNVESTIAELSGIFTQLTTMVVQQGELAIRFAFCFSIWCLTVWLIVLKLSVLDVLNRGEKWKPWKVFNLVWFQTSCPVAFDLTWLIWAGLMITWMSRWQMLKVLAVHFWGILTKYHRIGGLW